MIAQKSILVDSNLFVYCVDKAEPVKQQKAIELLDGLALSGRGYISTQTLGEFYNASTKRIKKPLTPADAAEQVESLASTWNILLIKPETVLEAARGAARHSFHYWDAQIWATAKMNGIDEVWSEDFSHGAIIDGVRFFNPFK